MIITIKATERNREKKKEEKNEIKRNKIEFSTLHTHHRIKKLQMHNSIQNYRKREEKEKRQSVCDGGGGGGGSRSRRRRRRKRIKQNEIT